MLVQEPTFSNSVTSFLQFYQYKSTQKSYKYCLKKFLSFLYPHMPTSAKNVFDCATLDVIAQRFLTEPRNYERDILNYIVFMKEAAPKTLSTHLTVIRTFMLDHDVALSARFWHRLRRKVPKARARTRDKAPSTEELALILHHSSITGKALFLLLAVSGMRVGEATQLDIDDVDFTHRRIFIRPETAKTGMERVVFFTEEAGEYLNVWLGYRDQYTRAFMKR